MADVNYIGSITLGKIKSWDDKKASTITPISFPGQDAGKTEGIDTLGVIAYVNFAGQWTGDFASIQGYISAIKGVADGAQLSSQTLRSPFVNSRDSADTIRFGSMSANTTVTAHKLVDTGALFSTRGVQVNDIVKNLNTGLTANVSGIDSETTLSIDADIFTASGAGYAVTATINCKVLSINVKWELPGLSICTYQISIMQVK